MLHVANILWLFFLSECHPKTNGQRLLDHLFTNISLEARPGFNITTPINVTFGIELLQLPVK